MYTLLEDPTLFREIALLHGTAVVAAAMKVLFALEIVAFGELDDAVLVAHLGCRTWGQQRPFSFAVAGYDASGVGSAHGGATLGTVGGIVTGSCDGNEEEGGEEGELHCCGWKAGGGLDGGLGRGIGRRLAVSNFA